MTADDVTQRAARIINEANWKADFKGGARADEIARALDAVGLLVTPERLKAAQVDYLSGKYPEFIRKHDAAVAAKALRDAADEIYGDERAAAQHWHPLSAVSWLRERADRIEREAGGSDADA